MARCGSVLAFALLAASFEGAAALQPRMPLHAEASDSVASAEVQQWQQQQHSKGPTDPHAVTGSTAALQQTEQQRLPIATAAESKARGGRFEFVPMVAAVFLYGATGCVLLVTAVFVLCCLCDAAARWLHRARFYSCVSKVRQVHEVFRKRKGEQLLCPYCVEPISTRSMSSGPVVFLCGHRFHTDCANRWFLENPGKSGRCPTCEGPEISSRTKCESLAFILSSLRRKYPDIITDANLKRWASCHTEIWLSELQCPKYRSMFWGEKLVQQ